MIFTTSFSTFTIAKENNLLEDFMGSWYSDGDAFGRPASTNLTFEQTLNNQFVLLNYQINTGSLENLKPLFTGIAYYKQLIENELKAYWVDSTGDLHPIVAKFNNNTLISHWGGEGPKLGRTQYELVDTNEMIVTDWIFKNDDWIEFNKNTFTRVSTL